MVHREKKEGKFDKRIGTKNFSPLVSIATILGTAIGILLWKRFNLDSSVAIGMGFLTSVVILFIGFLIRSYLKKIVLGIEKTMKNIKQSIYFFVTGDREILDLLDRGEKFKGRGKAFQEIHSGVLSLANTELASKVFFFDKMEEDLYIVHSHREETKHEKDSYIRVYPKDEIDLLQQLDHWAISYGIPRNRIKIKCSCDEEDFSLTEDDLKQNLIIIGSPSSNLVARKIMEKIKNRKNNDFKLHFHLDEDDVIRPMEGVGHEEPYQRNIKEKLSYGLLTRIGNPFNLESYVVMVGGCHREGQKIFPLWASKFENLYKLAIEYPNECIQFILKANYEDGEDPEVIEDTIELVGVFVLKKSC